MSMTLTQYAALLETSDARIDRESAVLLAQAADDLATYAQSIAHKQSGRMAGSIHRLGPFPVGDGALEATIQSGAWYAEEEVKKGGEHDWATRTIEEQAARLQQLADAVGGAVVRALTGG